MKATEFRIGNLIASGNEFTQTSVIGKILEIGNEERQFEQIYCECDESYEWFFKDSYCGIPLSEKSIDDFKQSYHQLISKNRKVITFSSAEENVCTFKQKFKLIFLHCDFKKNVFYVKIGSQKFYIKFIHQLQNLYFALTEKELYFKGFC